jgi:hypothetical protein
VRAQVAASSGETRRHVSVVSVRPDWWIQHAYVPPEGCRGPVPPFEENHTDTGPESIWYAKPGYRVITTVNGSVGEASFVELGSGTVQSCSAQPWAGGANLLGARKDGWVASGAAVVFRPGSDRVDVITPIVLADAGIHGGAPRYRGLPRALRRFRAPETSAIAVSKRSIAGSSFGYFRNPDDRRGGSFVLDAVTGRVRALRGCRFAADSRRLILFGAPSIGCGGLAVYDGAGRSLLWAFRERQVVGVSFDGAFAYVRFRGDENTYHVLDRQTLRELRANPFPNASLIAVKPG